MLAGVGKITAAKPLTEEALRRAAGSAVRQLAGVGTVTLALPTASLGDVAAVAEGAAMGAYSFTEYRSSKDDLKDPVKSVVIVTDFAADRALKPVLDRAALIGKAVNATRSLVNQPPSPPPPPSLGGATEGTYEGPPRRAPGWGRGGKGREGLAASSASARAPPASRASSRSSTPPPVPPPRSPSSARASPSTPAASRSSPPRAWSDMKTTWPAPPPSCGVLAAAALGLP